jgi:hypothetical protein
MAREMSEGIESASAQLRQAIPPLCGGEKKALSAEGLNFQGLSTLTNDSSRQSDEMLTPRVERQP